MRVWQAGWHCVSVPEARVYHAVGQSTFQAGWPPADVLRRRRIGAESNRAAIVLKYFSGFSLAWAPVLLGRPLVGHVACCRFTEAQIYLEAIRRTWTRWPSIRRFRQLNGPLRSRKPGRMFFRAAEFARPRIGEKAKDEVSEPPAECV